eukprot:g19882.t1
MEFRVYGGPLPWTRQGDPFEHLLKQTSYTGNMSTSLQAEGHPIARHLDKDQSSDKRVPFAENMYRLGARREATDTYISKTTLKLCTCRTHYHQRLDL